MKYLLMVTAVLGLAACGATTTGGADAGADVKGFIDARADVKGHRDAGTDGAIDARTVTVACADCLSETVSWGENGGMVAYTESSALTPCRTYMYALTPSGGTTSDGGPRSCSVEIGGCDAGPVAVHDVEQALADPDVIEALAGSTPLYGTDPRPCDGSVLAITVGTKTIEVGGDCGTSSSCIAGSRCVPVPAGVRTLANVLARVDQESLKIGQCARLSP